MTYDYKEEKRCEENEMPKSIWAKMPKSIWASMASSYNYVSPVHSDNDSFLSCLTTTLYPYAEPSNGRFQYPHHCKI